MGVGGCRAGGVVKEGENLAAESAVLRSGESGRGGVQLVAKPQVNGRHALEAGTERGSFVKSLVLNRSLSSRFSLFLVHFGPDLVLIGKCQSADLRKR
jgi:hypothetical protein